MSADRRDDGREPGPESAEAVALRQSDAEHSNALERPTRAPDRGGWSGDEHKLELAAAREAGLDSSEVELELYTDGFKSAMVLDDPEDHAIVFRGRTVLSREQLVASLRSVFDFVKIPRAEVALAVHDGRFELRVPAGMAERAPASMEHAKVALRVWLAAGVFGTMMLQWHQAAATIVWGLGLITGGWLLRRGVVSGRAMLGARLAVALGMFAQEEQLILPLRQD